MSDVNPILVGMELSGKFVEIIIDLMLKFPEEWKFSDLKTDDKFRQSALPKLEHKNGIVIELWCRENGVIASTENLVGTIIRPAMIPMEFEDQKKLAAACQKLSKILILKSLDYERLLKEGGGE